MSSGNQDLLHSLLFSVRKVDLGADKGTYYVLRMGPFETVERARDLCSALKDRNIGCLVSR
jgi:cell division septation protein DedD